MKSSVLLFNYIALSLGNNISRVIFALAEVGVGREYFPKLKVKHIVFVPPTKIQE